MRVEPGIEGGIVVQGTPEEWARVRERLAEMVAELTNDVLPAGEDPESGGVVVDAREALTIMALVDDEEFTRSVVRFVLDPGTPDQPPAG
jgi:hypothetical protein